MKLETKPFKSMDHSLFLHTPLSLQRNVKQEVKQKTVRCVYTTTDTNTTHSFSITTHPPPSHPLLPPFHLITDHSVRTHTR